MKTQVTHLSLDELHRRMMAMRSAQLGLSLSAYIGALIDRDAQQSGLVDFLGEGSNAKACDE